MVLRALIKMTSSWRFCFESVEPGELVVVFTNTANYRVVFFFFFLLKMRLQERWHGRFKYEDFFPSLEHVELPREVSFCF